MEVEVLWETYQQDPSIENRNRLVLYYLGNVNRLAAWQYRRVANHTCAISDLVSYGVIGLIEAIERFIPERGDFQSYSGRRVTGAMRDGLRQMKWGPRGVNAKVTTINHDHRDHGCHFKTVDDRDELDYVFRDLDRRELFVAIAYHMCGRSQDRVAAYLACSRTTVARILAKIEDVFQEAV